MRSFLLGVLLGVLVGTQSRNTYANIEDVEWNSYKMEYNKNYTELEDLSHFRVFQDNKRMIEAHNKRWAAGAESFEMGINQFTDLSYKQIAKLMMDIKYEYKEEINEANIDETDEEAAQYETETEEDYLRSLEYGIDWRKSKVVTPVQRQGRYKNSWAFAAAGAIESRRAIATGKLVPLSKQNLIDCCQSKGDLLKNAFSCLMSRGGIESEASYPYRGAKRSCQFNKKLIAAKVSGFKSCRRFEEALARIVYNGPVAASISLDAIIHYKSGVYNRNCVNPEEYFVLIVGYGYDVVFGDYWLLKTSLGTSYGEKGYIRLARNHHNRCGIANGAVVPILKFRSASNFDLVL